MPYGISLSDLGSVYGGGRFEKDKKLSLNRIDPSHISKFYTQLLIGDTFTPRNKFLTTWSHSTPRIKEDIYAPEGITKLLNETWRFIESIEAPNLKIGNGTVIDEGRGAYRIQGEGIVTPTDPTFTITYRESQTPCIERIFHQIMELNSKPFSRPVDFILHIDFLTDQDALTPYFFYSAYNVRPIEFKTVDANHDGKVILLRTVTFACSLFKPTVEDKKFRVPKPMRVNILPKRNPLLDLAREAINTAEDTYVVVRNIQNMVDVNKSTEWKVNKKK